MSQKALLVQGLAVTRQITEQAVDNEQRAQATLDLNRAQLEQQRQQVNVLDSQEKQAQAALKAQQAARDLAEINLGYTRITAPLDGMVGERLVRPGQYVSVGTQVISLVPLPNLWVVANYKETQMTRIRVGQSARVTVDAFPGTVLRGHVDSRSPASGAQFSLLPRREEGAIHPIIARSEATKQSSRLLRCARNDGARPRSRGRFRHGGPNMLLHCLAACCAAVPAIPLPRRAIPRFFVKTSG